MDLSDRLSDLVEIADGIEPTKATPWEISTLAGLAPSHVALILRRGAERRGAGLSGKTAAALAKVLGCSTDWLLTGEGERPTPEAVRAAVERARTAAPEVAPVAKAV